MPAPVLGLAENRFLWRDERRRTATNCGCSGDVLGIRSRCGRLRQPTMAREPVSIAIEPAIAFLKDPTKTWQTEERIEGPGPPNLPRHKQVGVRSRFQVPARSQNQDIAEQILRRYLQASVGRRRLQWFEGKTS